jgi:hypothetical protein
VTICVYFILMHSRKGINWILKSCDGVRLGRLKGACVGCLLWPRSIVSGFSNRAVKDAGSAGCIIKWGNPIPLGPSAGLVLDCKATWRVARCGPKCVINHYTAVLFAVSVKPLVLIVGVKDVPADASTAARRLVTARPSVRAMVSILPGARSQPDVATFISLTSSSASACSSRRYRVTLKPVSQLRCSFFVC